MSTNYSSTFQHGTILQWLYRNDDSASTITIVSVVNVGVTYITHSTYTIFIGVYEMVVDLHACMMMTHPLSVCGL